MAKGKSVVALKKLQLIPVGQVAEFLVAKQPGISRQAIHKAIQAGKIDAYRSLSAKGKRPVVLVSPSDVEKYLSNRG